jgi:AcrR family transcriptional regulator
MARPNRWDEVVASAAKVFRQRGFAQASLEEIADNLGMLKGSLYNYISTKEDLLTAVIRIPTERIVREAGRIANSEGTSEQKVRALVSLHIDVIVDIYDFAAVYLHEIAKSNLAEDWHERDRQYITLVEGVMAAAVEDGTFRSTVNPHVAAMTMIGACNWLTKWWNPEGSVRGDDMAQQISDTLLGGLCPRVGGTPRISQYEGTGVDRQGSAGHVA